MKLKSFLLFFIFGTSIISYSQTEELKSIPDIKLNAEKIAKFSKYIEYKHGFTPGGYEAWKTSNKLQYTKEMWYYTESFYVKRNQYTEGVSMNDAGIDISRFENKRIENEESIISIAGFRDVIVLLPSNKLIYKPN